MKKLPPDFALPGRGTEKYPKSPANTQLGIFFGLLPVWSLLLLATLCKGFFALDHFSWKEKSRSPIFCLEWVLCWVECFAVCSPALYLSIPENSALTSTFFAILLLFLGAVWRSQEITLRDKVPLEAKQEYSKPDCSGTKWDFSNFASSGCESVRPVQGSKTPKSVNEALGVKKPHFESKNPNFWTGHHRENLVFWLETPFSGVGNVFFWLQTSFPDFSEIPKRGRSRRGRCAIFSQIARQICAKLPLFRFVHHTKGAQNCRKFVANSTLNFGQFYANTPFPMPPSWNFCILGFWTLYRADGFARLWLRRPRLASANLSVSYQQGFLQTDRAHTKGVMQPHSS